MSKNILIIGNGAREHVLAWKLGESLRVNHVYTAPALNGALQTCGGKISVVGKSFPYFITLFISDLFNILFFLFRFGCEQSQKHCQMV